MNGYNNGLPSYSKLNSFESVSYIPNNTHLPIFSLAIRGICGLALCISVCLHRLPHVHPIANRGNFYIYSEYCGNSQADLLLWLCLSFITELNPKAWNCSTCNARLTAQSVQWICTAPTLCRGMDNWMSGQHQGKKCTRRRVALEAGD